MQLGTSSFLFLPFTYELLKKPTKMDLLIYIVWFNSQVNFALNLLGSSISNHPIQIQCSIQMFKAQGIYPQLGITYQNTETLSNGETSDQMAGADSHLTKRGRYMPLCLSGTTREWPLMSSKRAILDHSSFTTTNYRVISTEYSRSHQNHTWLYSLRPNKFLCSW